MIPLSWYLFVAAILFCIGLFGVLSRRNTIAILLGLEFMLNAVNINLVAFWQGLGGSAMAGLVFAVVVFTVAAAEVAIGLAIVISVYRARRTIIAADISDMKE